MKNLSTSLGHKIWSLRNARRWTQQDLADKLGVSRASVASWETGRANPSDAQLKRIAEKFQVQYTFFRPQTYSVSKTIEKAKDICLNNIDQVCGELSENLLRSTFLLCKYLSGAYKYKGTP